MNLSDEPNLVDHLLREFAANLAEERIEIYNEFSLQHELGLLLRISMPRYKVQFERNVNFFFPMRLSFVKHEIDICAYSPDKKQLACALELKYPRNGQYPEQMFSFCKDLQFAEELLDAGFSNAALIVFADDELFYRGKGMGIYEYFRAGRPLTGCVRKPTGKMDAEVLLRGRYVVEWRPVKGSLCYTVIKASSEPRPIREAQA
jgi:hypothetical protein